MQTRRRTSVAKDKNSTTESFFNKIKNRFYKSSVGKHTLHILNCLRYFVIIMACGIGISTTWNAIMGAWFGDKYTISMFEAAIIWACLF